MQIKVFRFILIITLLLNYSCKSQKTDNDLKAETTEKFINQIKINNPDSVFSMTFNRMSFQDDEHKLFELNAASKLLKQYGVAPRNKWKVESDPNNNFDRVKFTIPILNNTNPATYLIVSFPPPEISEKIGWYRIEGGNFIQGRTISPDDFSPPQKLLVPKKDSAGS